MAAELPPGLVHSDFDDIHSAVMETSRGRWFLAEYARRNKVGDTRMLLDAIARLENVLGAGPAAVTSLAATGSASGPFAATAGQIAERLADICWDMRERGLADDVCAAVDRQATAVQGLARRLSSAPSPDGPAPERGEQLQLAVRCQIVPASAAAQNRPVHAQSPLAHLDALPLASRLEMFV